MIRIVEHRVFQVISHTSWPNESSLTSKNNKETLSNKTGQHGPLTYNALHVWLVWLLTAEEENTRVHMAFIMRRSTKLGHPWTGVTTQNDWNGTIA